MGESTLPCGTGTRERLEELRGDEFRSWDSFLNYLGDMFEEYDSEYRNAGPNPSGDGGEFPELATKEDVERLADEIGHVPERTAEELEGRMR